MKRIYQNIMSLEVGQTKMSQFKDKKELVAIQQWLKRQNKKGRIFKYHVWGKILFITRIT